MDLHNDSERPSKRSKLLSDESDSESSEGETTPVISSTKPSRPLSNGFMINEEYAKRFEHNKKREELHRLEEKYKDTSNAKRKRLGINEEDDDESEQDESTSEEEDDDAELATMEVDQEIFDTLKAIREKDPRVYDNNIKFYKEFDPEADGSTARQTNEKPMYLRDYHRQNLMEGYTGDDGGSRSVPTYQEEQDALKEKLVGSMHAANVDDSDAEGENEDFLVAKSKPRHADLPAPRKVKITDTDIKGAEQDPETYLSNFMAARAWLPNEGSKWQAFESDNSDDDARADAFEEAYNMRFEDPKMANEKLQSFARDVGKYGVRRDEKTRRKLAREQERQAKDAQKQERDEEKARLRKLKIEEAEEKIRRIKSVAGIKGEELDLDAWKNVIDGDFDDEAWEEEMSRRFGDAYYAQADRDEDGSDGDNDAESNRKRKVKKPKWDDDIDITDLIPDFDAANPDVQLTSDEDDGGVPVLPNEDADEEDADHRKRKTKKDRAKEKIDAKRVARKERAKLEEMIDASMPLSHPDLAPAASSSDAAAVLFRYRETSPTTFGMSSRDILFADDAQLNQFAGLKKLAAFRDDEKKRKDRKKFSKKARLRQWRKETFGDPDEPSGGFEKILGEGESAEPNGVNASKTDAKEGSRKKKRSKKKAKTEVAE